VYTLSFSTVLQLCLTCLAVWACSPARLALSFNAALPIIVFGVIFPLTHAISENFRRREHATCVLAQMYASATSLYWGHLDWPLYSSEAKQDAEYAGPLNCGALLHDFLGSVRLLMITDTREEAYSAAYRRCMRNLRSLSACNDALGQHVGYTKAGEGGVSRLAQYTRYLVRPAFAISRAAR